MAKNLLLKKMAASAPHLDYQHLIIGKWLLIALLVSTMHLNQLTKL